MRFIRLIIPIVALIIFGISTLKTRYQENNVLKEVLSGKVAAKYQKSLFVGSWHSDQAGEIIEIKNDGTWKLGNITGKWVIYGADFVWIYNDSSNNMTGKLDKNPILSVGDKQFVLKELDGSKTTFFKK